MSKISKLPNRWLLATCAVGIHISIGSVYAYSVWKLPIEAATPWTGSQFALAFSLAILFLGLSAGFLGKWIDRLGPRRSALLAALLFAGGLIGAGQAIAYQQLTAFYLTYGLLGGIGLGIGYVAPVSMLVRWFPDRRGLATGLATMGFGFGALLAGPLIVSLVQFCSVPTAFLLLGTGYASLMLLSSIPLCNPPPDWAARFPAPAGAPPADAPAPAARDALRHPAFSCLWILFFINICCGIALIAIASAMAQEQAGLSPKAAAGMVGLMGLFNGFGRIGWSAASDRIGRGRVWLLFFLLQIAAFLLLPHLRHPLAFQAAVFLILTCYGGGFATAPAFLGDLFGTKHLSSLYGVLLTAWSAAGLVGPLLITYLRDSRGDYQAIPLVFASALALGLLLQGLLSRSAAKLKNPG